MPKNLLSANLSRNLPPRYYLLTLARQPLTDSDKRDTAFSQKFSNPLTAAGPCTAECIYFPNFASKYILTMSSFRPRAIGLAFLFAFVSVAAALGSPALRLRARAAQPDGSVLTIVKCGDERAAFTATADGYAVVRGAAGGYYYAVSPASGDGGLQASAVLAHDKSVRTAFEQQWVEANAAAGHAIMAAAAAKSRRQRPATRATLGSSARPAGEHTYPVILAAFRDVDFTTPNPADTFNLQFNQEGYSEGGAVGSVRDYFVAQSRGAYTPNFDVVGVVRLPHSRAYYGTHTQSDVDSNVPRMVRDAVDLAEAAGVDFSRYRSGGSNEVPMVAVVYAGVGEHSSWEEDAVWASFYSNRTRYSKGSIASFLVTCELMPEFWEYTDHEDTIYHREGIGTFCHEFSHFLGLPDFYDTENSSEIVAMSYWDVMDYGQYWRNGAAPVGYTAYEKSFMGWLDIPTLETSKQVVRLNALGSEGENACRIVNDSDRSGNEYYLLENRQPSTWYPRTLGSGMLVTHIDYDQSAWDDNEVNTVAGRERMSYLPADNSVSNESSSDADDYRGDLFPGLTGNTSLRDNGSPGFMQHTGGSMGKYLTCITDTGGIVSFVYMAEGILPQARNIRLAAAPDGSGLTVSWDTVPHATAYMLAAYDGATLLHSLTAQSPTATIPGFPGAKSLTVYVTATASDYINSPTAGATLENPVGIRSAQLAPAQPCDVFTLAGERVLRQATEADARRLLPKGIYIMRGGTAARKLLVE